MTDSFLKTHSFFLPIMKSGVGKIKITYLILNFPAPFCAECRHLHENKKVVIGISKLDIVLPI